MLTANRLLSHGALPRKPEKPRAAIYAWLAARALCIGKTAMPLQPHLATIVFPAFGRSLFAAGEDEVLSNTDK